MKKRRNSYLRTINKLFWELDEMGAVERLLGVYRYPGAPLRLIAKNLGVSDIVEEELPFEGGVFYEDGKTIIKVNALNSIVRQKFTLAHELGHLIFIERFSVVAECLQDTQLESACDRLAVELLMPRQETVQYVHALGAPSPENLRVVAKRFGVSLQVAARRVEELELWHRSVGLWEYSGSPRQLWFVGKRLWHRPPNFVAFDLAKSSPVSVSTLERLPSTEYAVGIALQMLNLGRNVFLGLISTIPS